eukprot:Nitzschia sp. Nitz4//scaffold94_size78252//10915//11829//NITZ4_005458-RA/size78252-processed-gene-0.3-mRNA-1//1//CDS//3329560350//655//frame0
MTLNTTTSYDEKPVESAERYCPFSRRRGSTSSEQSNNQNSTEQVALQEQSGSPPPTSRHEHHHRGGWWGHSHSNNQNQVALATSYEVANTGISSNNEGGAPAPYAGAPPPYDHHYEYNHGGCGFRKHCRQMKEAERVADVIAKRNFADERIFQGGNQLIPASVGYGLLVGGATFLVLGFPARMFGRYHPSFRCGLKFFTIVPAIAAGTTYAKRYETLENLKIIGTHLSPHEPSANADALCRHPLIVKAMQDQKARAASHYGEDFPHRSSGWFLKGRIMAEYNRVLDNCRERSMSLAKKEQALVK